MGVGEGLEIGEVRGGATVAATMELDTFFDLSADAFLRVAVGRVECVVAAEGAASGADGAVAVRAAEAGVDADFLDAGTELLFHIGGVGIETPIVTPGEHSEIFCKDREFFRIDRIFRIYRTNRSNGSNGNFAFLFFRDNEIRI